MKHARLPRVARVRASWTTPHVERLDAVAAPGPAAPGHAGDYGSATTWR
jgi:hypothetical protein